MDGLECSEIMKTQLEYSGRIDPEYYQKKYIRYQSLVENCRNFELKEKTDFIVGPFGSSYNTENYVPNSGYRYIRGQDVKPFVLKDDDARYMTKEDFHRLSKYALKENDILVSVVGTLGNACIVQKKDIPGIFSCKSTVLRTNEMNPYYLLSYLNSKFGHDLLLRKERGAIQKGLNLGDLHSLLVPVLTSNIQTILESMIKRSLNQLEHAKSIYKSAETTLLYELGIQTDAFPSSTISIKSFSQSLSTSGRLDAEYYQAKYDFLFHKLKQFPCKKLGGNHGIVTITKSIEPGSAAYRKQGIPFIRVGDVTKFGISEPEIFLPEDIAKDVSSLYPKKETILFSKDGSAGIAYKLEKDKKLITSGALLHLTVCNMEDVLPDYLTLVLNSPVVQLQAERDSNGAIIQHWKPSEIKNVIIPVLNKNIQKEITSKVQKSFALRHQSEQFMQYSKKAVEIAIEQNEEAAIQWLKAKGI